ncbi:glycoside hydrolase family 3 N-terminal domain-containing protein [Alteromonadaceae bacterium BrNp21-10]|nr:glycoside hydrolase family 3 N-terminal domain-containing protein [Alteromonadaceae bacterium BrNp21-10]
MTIKTTHSFALLSVVLAISGCNAPEQPKLESAPAPASATANIWPVITSNVQKNADIEQRIDALLATMTLEQKVAQTIQPEIRDISVEDMRQYGFGSYLNGGGAFPNNNKHATVQDWVALAEAFYQASVDDSLDGSTIPTMWGTDAVHGHNNVIGATLFPHNIGLGAANNPQLIEDIAQATATEVMATGIDWVFAPTVAVVRDDRWGRTYESYSEDPEIVGKYAYAIVEGLQGKPNVNFLDDKHVIATTKHFIGDGGTEGGDDQGDNLASEQQLFDIHAQGYVGGLKAGSQAVMASFNSWHGVKSHGNKYLLTDVLKNQMGFDGLVVGDWNGHGQITGCTNESCPQAMNAGMDIFMVPTSAWKPLYENTIAQVKSGEIPQARLDDAVKRILRVKMRAGLFTKPSPAKRINSAKAELIGAAAHRKIAKQAVRESLVLLKNQQHLLPLVPQQHILVAGDGADNIGKQSGGWTITWQGTGNVNADFPSATSIYDGIKANVESAGGSVELNVSGEFEQKPDVAIVIFGEEPYAEGNGDLDNLEFQRGNKKDLALLRSLQQQNIPVVAVFITGRPLWVNPELNASDAFVVTWLPGSEGSAVADVLFQDAQGNVQHDFKGKLSFSWPKTPQQMVNRHDANYAPLLPYGFGLTYADDDVLGSDLSETIVSTDDGELATLDLYNRTVQAPWQLQLTNQQQQTTMNSSQAAINNLNIRTTDRRVQEDALRIQWHHGTTNAVSFAYAFPNDLRTYVEQSASVVLDIKVNNANNATLALGIDCQLDCENVVDISDHINAYEPNTWQTLSVNLGCFTGTDWSQVFTALSLISDSDLDVSVSDVKYANVETAGITCP